jgi:hypothetical protein
MRHIGKLLFDAKAQAALASPTSTLIDREYARQNLGTPQDHLQFTAYQGLSRDLIQFGLDGQIDPQVFRWILLNEFRFPKSAGYPQGVSPQQALANYLNYVHPAFDQLADQSQAVTPDQAALDGTLHNIAQSDLANIRASDNRGEDTFLQLSQAEANPWPAGYSFAGHGTIYAGLANDLISSGLIQTLRPGQWKYFRDQQQQQQRPYPNPVGIVGSGEDDAGVNQTPADPNLLVDDRGVPIRNDRGEYRYQTADGQVATQHALDLANNHVASYAFDPVSGDILQNSKGEYLYRTPNGQVATQHALDLANANGANYAFDPVSGDIRQNSKGEYLFVAPDGTALPSADIDRINARGDANDVWNARIAFRALATLPGVPSDVRAFLSPLAQQLQQNPDLFKQPDGTWPTSAEEMLRVAQGILDNHLDWLTGGQRGWLRAGEENSPLFTDPANGPTRNYPHLVVASTAIQPPGSASGAPICRPSSSGVGNTAASMTEWEAMQRLAFIMGVHLAGQDVNQNDVAALNGQLSALGIPVAGNFAISYADIVQALANLPQSQAPASWKNVGPVTDPANQGATANGAGQLWNPPQFPPLFRVDAPNDAVSADPSQPTNRTPDQELARLLNTPTDLLSGGLQAAAAVFNFFHLPASQQAQLIRNWADTWYTGAQALVRNPVGEAVPTISQMTNDAAQIGGTVGLTDINLGILKMGLEEIATAKQLGASSAAQDSGFGALIERIQRASSMPRVSSDFLTGAEGQVGIPVADTQPGSSADALGPTSRDGLDPTFLIHEAPELLAGLMDEPPDLFGGRFHAPTPDAASGSTVLAEDSSSGVPKVPVEAPRGPWPVFPTAGTYVSDEPFVHLSYIQKMDNPMMQQMRLLYLDYLAKTGQLQKMVEEKAAQHWLHR